MIITLVYSRFRIILIAAVLLGRANLAASEIILFEAPLGTLSFVSIHEAGHVTVAKSCGFLAVSAKVFQMSKYGVGTFWKGQTSLTGGGAGKGMALIKLGGRFAEQFLDKSNRIHQPSFLDVIGDRSIISHSDKLSQIDLGSFSLLEAQRRTYLILTSRMTDLDRIYKSLYHRHTYP
ncbi:MAG: hypothetical protein WAW39_09915 [Prosthecobacter sp.]|uniref:hypothetical protein n=1 Tax=Prosthecobacter sp. TaxID=1965333 RepID=UPI003BAEA1AE